MTLLFATVRGILKRRSRAYLTMHAAVLRSQSDAERIPDRLTKHRERSAVWRQRAELVELA